MVSLPREQLAESLADPALTESDLLASHLLLGCFIREISGPEMDMTSEQGHFVIRLPKTVKLLRVGIKRYSAGGAHRFQGGVQMECGSERDEEQWRYLTLEELGGILAAELTLRSGEPNSELAEQLAASRDALADIAVVRPVQLAREVAQPAADYLDSEQALIAGHPRHPTPKWRSGDIRQWRKYSPETRSHFPLRWLAVPDELAQDYGEDFDRHAAVEQVLADLTVPEGHRALPVHPWQYQLLLNGELSSVFTSALATGAVRDLGFGGVDFFPTASVRTLYQPEADVFLKMSLNVRITNCLRKNAEYELSGAVQLTDVLNTPLKCLTERYPRFSVLAEPAARSIRLPSTLVDDVSGRALLEGLGVIVREGVSAVVRPGERLHLAGTLAAADSDPAGTQTRLADLAVLAGLAGFRSDREWARQWWRRYLEHLVPPVLALWAEHGVVLEPHLQNVLVLVGEDYLPSGVVLRDMEGTKLVDIQYRHRVPGLSDDVVRAAFYDEERAWNRVAYCLFVNNLVEIASALADWAGPGSEGEGDFEASLWRDAYDLLSQVTAELGSPEELQAVLSGAPLPAKTNLLLRWSRQADRCAGYVPFPNPLLQPEKLSASRRSHP